MPSCCSVGQHRLHQEAPASRLRPCCRYSDAARLRDELKKVQEAASAAADRDSLDRRRLETSRKLRLGQRVMHARRGFRGLICGCGPSPALDRVWQALDPHGWIPAAHLVSS